MIDLPPAAHVVRIGFFSCFDDNDSSYSSRCGMNWSAIMTDLKVICRRYGSSIEELSNILGYSRRGMYKLFERKPLMVKYVLMGIAAERVFK